MRAAPALGVVVALAMAVTLCAPKAWAQAPNPSFALANRGNQPIAELYATPMGVDNWGPDLLGRYSLSPGMTFPVRLPAGACTYDLRVVYADRSTEEKRRLNTCGVDSVAFPGARTAGTGAGAAGPRGVDAVVFRVINRGRVDINSVYASPTDDDDWGEDRLGDDTVAPGRAYVLRLPPGTCSYDVRVVFANNRAVERRGMNLCNTSDLTVP